MSQLFYHAHVYNYIKLQKLLEFINILLLKKKKKKPVGLIPSAHQCNQNNEAEKPNTYM
jgi:hypothetical protein